ncbi:MAG: site-specific integrase [Bacteroidetes bacterium]|nr:site-specific integrase [Bacteroidota bacterium]
MRTSIVLALDTRSQKEDGTYPVKLRIIHHEKSTAIGLGIYLKREDWDEKARCVKSSYKGTVSVIRLNNLLQKKKSEALDIVTKLDDKKTLDLLSVVQLKNLIQRNSDSSSFFEFGQSLVDAFLDTNHLGNYRIYKCTLSVLKSFNGGKDMSFRDITYALLTKFEHAHLKKGKTLNGLAVYMRTIRSIYNQAIKSGLVEQELYPFKTYEIKTTKTRKRAISMEAIKSIQNLQIDPKSHLYNARNYFMASFYMRGISFTDLAHLKLSDIIDGRIFYDRQKTGKPYDIKITQELQAILDFYLPGKSKFDFIFPIIQQTELKKQYKEVQDKRKRFNANLRRIAKLCGIGENLTSYVSRHSFATRAKNLGVPIAAISDMLGHADTKTTEVYLKGLSSDIMDDFHRKIIE